MVTSVVCSIVRIATCIVANPGSSSQCEAQDVERSMREAKFKVSVRDPDIPLNSIQSIHSILKS